MNISFLGQGLEPESNNSVGKKLQELFADTSFNKFTGISAFASKSAISGLGKFLESEREHFSEINLIVGIDQEGTSKDALEGINKLKINSYIFYQKESPIFHPKIYLFEGESKTSLIVGSSNLTARGLFGNIESSLMVEFENEDESGVALLTEFKDYYRSLLDYSDPNLFKIDSEIITFFVDSGVVPAVQVWRNKHGKNTSGSTVDSSNTIIVPKRNTVKIPSVFKGKYKTDNDVGTVIEELEIVALSDDEFSNSDLLWTSNHLSERDLNIPRSSGTNPTGAMNFTKGLLHNIDQRRYFREEIFSNLDWNYSTRRGSPHIELANVIIRLIILGIDYGNYSLVIRHDSRTDTPSYAQNNSMTSLSWGKVKKIVAQRELLGRRAFLYRNPENQSNFILVIR